MNTEMDRYPDDELLSLARRFERNALAAIYDRYSDGIYYYALRMLADPDLAEECTAETFHRFLRALRHGGGPNSNMKAYLYQTAHNWITDHFRRIPPLQLEDQAELGNPDDVPSREAEQNILQGRVQAALRLLTAEQQQVILLRFIEGWNSQEIADCLQKSVGAVKALQHRALAALQQLLLNEERREDVAQQ